MFERGISLTEEEKHKRRKLNLSEEQKLKFHIQNYTEILKTCIKIEKSIITFADIVTEKQTFQQQKNPTE